MRIVAVAILLAVIYRTTQASNTKTLRGVNPDQAHYYASTHGQFKCIDGSKSIPFERVNDNYCDCADGSDEPGTSACYNGQFYCRNRGFEPKILSASFVDDGVCDCCDGSDEINGCVNTCLEKSSSERTAIRAKAEGYERALAKKQEMIEQAKATRQQWSQRSHTIHADIQAQNSVVQQLKAQESEARAAWEAEQQKVDDEAAASGSSEHAHGDGTQPEDRTLMEEQHQQAPLEHEETAEELGRRIASQWTHDPEAASAPPAHEHEHEHEHEDPVEQEFEDEDDHTAHADEGRRGRGRQEPLSELEDLKLFLNVFGDYFVKLWDWFGHVLRHGIRDEVVARRQRQKDMHELRVKRRQSQGSTPSDPSLSPTKPEVPEDSPLGVLTAQLKEAEERLEQLEKEKQDIEKYANSGIDFGPNDVFLPLAGRCITDHGSRWVFEACFFEKATQTEPHATWKTTVGQWKGFEQDYTVAQFDNGDTCYNAPNRSYRIQLSCAETEQLYQSEEPSTCVYSAYMTTPAVCSQQELQAVKAQLAELERLEAEIMAEIAAAEGAPASKHDEL